jgi:DNA mismatch repair ATPase MutS
VPDAVVKRAKQLLIRLEKENIVGLGDASDEPSETMQTSLEALTIDDPIVEQIKHMELERTTPLDALNELKEMQDKIKQREK